MNGVISWLAKTSLLMTELNELAMRIGLFLPTLMTLLLTLSGVGKLVLTLPDRLVCEVTRVIGTVYRELLICVTASFPAPRRGIVARGALGAAPALRVVTLYLRTT